MLGETPDFPAIFAALKNGEAGVATDFAALSTPSLVAGLGVSVLLSIPLECNDNSEYNVLSCKSYILTVSQFTTPPRPTLILKNPCRRELKSVTFLTCRHYDTIN